MTQVNHISAKLKRQGAVRKKLHGTASRPRLSVYRSNLHLSAQLIDDDKGLTLTGITDADKGLRLKGTKTEKAIALGEELAKKMKAKKIKTIIFDRGSYRYHGRVKAFAESLRKQGIKF